MKDEIAILYKYKKPPWGGGNQFLLALRDILEKKGVRVVDTIGSKTKACLFNSHNVDFTYFNTISYKNINMVHRVDGPISLYRGSTSEIDDMIFLKNNQLADITVFQSNFSFNKTIELGYKPVDPVIISNAVNSEIFNRIGKKSFSRKRKIKLISTSWSNNIRKGYPVYKWLDENLDWDRFEYTFLGRVYGDFSNIRLVSPKPSEQVAKILKDHDIYITASMYEPCSNALVEALSCGLPVLYLNSGSHNELVKQGGLSFVSNEETLSRLDKLVSDYEIFQNNIVVQDINVVADMFIAAFGFSL